jgi:hypothetical protein
MKMTAAKPDTDIVSPPSAEGLAEKYGIDPEDFRMR